MRRSIKYWYETIAERKLEYWEVREILKDLQELKNYLEEDHKERPYSHTKYEASCERCMILKRLSEE